MPFSENPWKMLCSRNARTISACGINEEIEVTKWGTAWLITLADLRTYSRQCGVKSPPAEEPIICTQRCIVLISRLASYRFVVLLCMATHLHSIHSRRWYTANIWLIPTRPSGLNTNRGSFLNFEIKNWTFLYKQIPFSFFRPLTRGTAAHSGKEQIQATKAMLRARNPAIRYFAAKDRQFSAKLRIALAEPWEDGPSVYRKYLWVSNCHPLNETRKSLNFLKFYFFDLRKQKVR